MYSRFNKNKDKKIIGRFNPHIFNLVKNVKNNKTEQNIKNISVVIEGRLGNQLFEIISCWAYAKKFNMNFTLDKSYEKRYNTYYNYFFKSIPLNNNNIKYTLKNFHPYVNIFNRMDLFMLNNVLIKSYLQNSGNFNKYREEILSLFFNIHDFKPKNNKFFIHIRLTDFLSSPMHNLNLESYYTKAIKYLYTIPDKIEVKQTIFYIISDDIDKAKTKNYLNLLPKDNLVFIDNKEYNEIKTLELCSDCCSGAIIGHSSFAWWGAYIINCQEKIVVCPDRFLKGNHDFSGFYLNYKIISI